jgi:hypothetical protein
MRWAVGFALLMALLFAFTVAYNFGVMYVNDLLAR